MKKPAFYFPLFFGLILPSLFLVHSMQYRKSRGFYVSVAGTWVAASCESDLRVVLRLSGAHKVSPGEEELTERSLTQRLVMIYQTRALRVIYIDADPNIEVGEVVHILDLVAQSAENVHVVFVTPGNRGQLCLENVLLPKTLP